MDLRNNRLFYTLTLLVLLATGFFVFQRHRHTHQRSEALSLEPAAPQAIATGSQQPTIAIKSAATQQPKIQHLISGELVWSSPLEPIGNDRFRRVRLLQTTFRHPLIRVEEELVQTPDSTEPTIIRQTAMVADQLLVGPASGTDEKAMELALGVSGISIIRKIPNGDLDPLMVVQIPATTGDDLPRARQTISALSDVAAVVEPNYLGHATAIPNDPGFVNQWALKNIAHPDRDINAETAWNTTTGADSVVVAVIDSGIDYLSNDLRSNHWTNAGEIANNKIDDDHNGYVDDKDGRDFFAGDKTPLDHQIHGTHVAGIIGARGNNSTGIAGVAWRVKLMALAVLDAEGVGDLADTIAAINYARLKGAHIINHSYVFLDYTKTLKDAIDAAGKAGILNVCAMDNRPGTNADISPSYPACFASTSVIGVGASDQQDQHAWFSDFGRNTVDLYAPGEFILSTIPGSLYSFASGTSVAAPQVTGIAVLLKAARPTLKANDLKLLILGGVDPLPALDGISRTGGRANAAKALSCLSDLSVTPASSGELTVNIGGIAPTNTRSYVVKNFGSTAANWKASFSGLYSAKATPASGRLLPGASVTVVVGAADNPTAAPGLYEGTFTITNTTSGKHRSWPLKMDQRRPAIYSFDLNTDPGWARTGAWEFGNPVGKGGGTDRGGSDPVSGHTGINVFGVNLNGNTTTTPAGTFTLTAGPFDLRGYTETTLKYWRWLNVASGYFSRMAIKSDQIPIWTALGETTSGPIYDSAWTEVTMDLTNILDEKSGVYIQWIYSIPETNPIPTSSWNIDDIRLLGRTQKRIYISGSPDLNENEGAKVYRVQIEPPSTTPVAVSLTSAAPSIVTTQPSVVIPAYASSAEFLVTPADDSILDGTQFTTISASATGYQSIEKPLRLNDNETATISLSIPQPVVEGATVLATVKLSAPPKHPVTVELTSNRPGVADFPASIVMRTSQMSSTFPIKITQNNQVDAPRTVLMTASVTNWTNGTAEFTVVEDEPNQLELGLPVNLAEGAPAYTGASVSIPTERSIDTVVSLSLSDATKLTIPATVTIPAGQLSAAFTIKVIEDTLQVASQVVNITATSPSFNSRTGSITVTASELYALAFDTIPSPTPLGSNSIYVNALDALGNRATGFTGTALVTAYQNGAIYTPFGTKTVQFYQGRASVSATWTSVGSNFALKAVSGTRSATSNTFSIDYPALNSIDLVATDLAFDPASNVLYGGTSGGNLVPINPATGVTDTQISVSTGAVGQLEIPPTGSILYAAVAGSTQLVRVNLATGTVGTPFAVGTNSTGTALTIVDFAILPQDTSTVAVVTTSPSGTYSQVALYKDGIKLADSLPETTGITQITAAEQPNRFYASTGNTDATSGTIFLLEATSTGLTMVKSYPMPGPLSGLTSSGNLLSSDSGRVLVGETGMQVGKVSHLTGNVILDSSSGRALQYVPPATQFSSGKFSVINLTGFSETGNYIATALGRPVKAGSKCIAYRSPTSVHLLRTYLFPEPEAPKPDLAVQQFATPNAVTANKTNSFNWLIKNQGTAVADNVVFTAQWATNTLVPAPYVGSSSTKGTVTHGQQSLSVAIGSMGVNETVTVSLQTITNSAASQLSSTWQIVSPSTESTTLNNLGAVTLNITTAKRFEADLPAEDLASVKSTGKVYATIGSSAGFLAGTLVIMDLSVPKIDAILPVGSSPGTIATGPQETLLSIALDGSGEIVPFDATTLQLGTAYPLGTNANGHQLFVRDMINRPTTSQLVVARRNIFDSPAGVAVIGASDLVGSPTPSTDHTQWLGKGPDDTTIYGFGKSTNQVGTVSQIHVSDAGVSVAGSRSGVELGGRPYYVSGRVIGSNGLILHSDTLADAESPLGGLVPTAQSIQFLTHDVANHAIFTYTTSASQFRRFRDDTFASVATFKNDSPRPAQVPRRLIRWGQGGLAYASPDEPLAGSGLIWINAPELLPYPTAAINLPSSVSENSAQVNGSISIDLAMDRALIIPLHSSLPGAFQVPASVTIPAGQLTAAFTATITDDTLLGADRTITVTSDPIPDLAAATATLQLIDNETRGLTITLPAVLHENDGMILDQAFITLTGGPVATDLVIHLTSSHPGKLDLVDEVVLPAGQTVLPFDLKLLDNTTLHATLNVTVTATINNGSSGTASVPLIDDEVHAIIMSLPASLTENEETHTAYIQLSLPTETDLTVYLDNPRPDVLQMPSSVVIYAGNNRNHFVYHIWNNLLHDGRKTTTITASSPDFPSEAKDITVIDDEIDYYEWSAVTDHTAGDYFDVTVKARTVDGDQTNAPNPPYTLNLLENDVPVPGMSGSLSMKPAYVLGGKLRITKAGTGMVLKAIINGTTVLSNPFSITAGPLSSFSWGDLPGPYLANTPIQVSIHAADGFGNPINNFSSPVELSAFRDSAMVEITGPIESAQPTGGLKTDYNQGRLTTIIPQSRINQAGTLRSVSLEIDTPPGRIYESFLIRGKTNTASENTYAWYYDGYTNLRSGPLDLTQMKGWVEIPFSNPIPWSNSAKLVLDFSFSNSRTASGGAFLGTLGGDTRSNQADLSNLFGPPESWVYRYPYDSLTPRLRLGFGTPINLTPTSTGTFINGAWTGPVMFSQGGAKLTLVATSGRLIGNSQAFDVGDGPPAAPVLVAEPTATKGLTNSVSWAPATAATEYYLESSAEASFASILGTSGWTSSLSFNQSGLNHGVDYFYRVKARQGSLEGIWSVPVHSAQDRFGPIIVVGGTEIVAPAAIFRTVRSFINLAGKIVDTPAGLGSLKLYSSNSNGQTVPLAPDGSWQIMATQGSIPFYALDSVGNSTERQIIISVLADADGNGLPDNWQSTYRLPLNSPNSTMMADFDGDGRKNLLEFAFNTPPNSPTGNKTPAASHEVNAADGKTYLMYRFDRRLEYWDLDYIVQFSTDLVHWSATSFQTEVVGPTVYNPDGATERVTMRIRPDITQLNGQQVFIRLQVATKAP